MCVCACSHVCVFVLVIFVFIRVYSSPLYKIYMAEMLFVIIPVQIMITIVNYVHLLTSNV